MDTLGITLEEMQAFSDGFAGSPFELESWGGPNLRAAYDVAREARRQLMDEGLMNG